MDLLDIVYRYDENDEMNIIQKYFPYIVYHSDVRLMLITRMNSKNFHLFVESDMLKKISASRTDAFELAHPTDKELGIAIERGANVVDIYPFIFHNGILRAKLIKENGPTSILSFTNRLVISQIHQMYPELEKKVILFRAYPTQIEIKELIETITSRNVEANFEGCFSIMFQNFDYIDKLIKLKPSLIENFYKESFIAHVCETNFHLPQTTINMIIDQLKIKYNILTFLAPSSPSLQAVHLVLNMSQTDVEKQVAQYNLEPTKTALINYIENSSNPFITQTSRNYISEFEKTLAGNINTDETIDGVYKNKSFSCNLHMWLNKLADGTCADFKIIVTSGAENETQRQWIENFKERECSLAVLSRE